MYHKVYYDEKTNTIMFKLSKLMEFLRQRSFPEKRINKISTILKDIGATTPQVEATTKSGKRVTAKVYALPPNEDLNHVLDVPVVAGEAI